MKRELIGLFNCSKEQIKEKYVPFISYEKIPLVTVAVYKNNKYGSIAKIVDGRDFMRKAFKGIRKSKKKINWDKPVDTSKWVKPDEESLRNSLITECFAVQILKEDSINYPTHHARMSLLYSILHSNSPKNPQTLTNFALLSEPIETILNECNTQYKSKRYFILFGKDGNKKVNMENARKVWKNWFNKITKKMIIIENKQDALDVKDGEEK